jgi:hypothetical protein
MTSTRRNDPMNDPHDSGDRYLWDRTGPPDEDVVRLERLLAPIAHRESAESPIAAAPARLRPWAAWTPFAIAAALLVAVGVVSLNGTQRASEPVVVEETGSVRVTAADGDVRAGGWVATGAAAREIDLGDVGRVTLHPGSRVQVRRVADDVARLYLERGRLEARIAARVRPRFFQVDTDAARCVDLGCRYELTAEPDGSSKVTVLTGQVSFEATGEDHATREVFVPERAVCWARRGRGPGTPRFADAPATLAAALDAFDAAADRSNERRESAKAAAAAALTNDDLLPIWHWLTDADAEVARLALTRLRERVGDPEDWTPPADRPGPADRDAFRAMLRFDR